MGVLTRALSRVVVALMVSFAVGSQAVVAICVVRPSGLVSWWPGDGSANDIVGTNHGSLVNGATFATHGVAQAFSFDGVNDYLHVAESATLDIVGEITIEAWVYPTAFGIPNYVVSKYQSYNLQVDGGRVVFGLPGPDGAELYGDSLISTGEWSHIAAVYDGSTMSIYVNGELDESASHAFGIATTNLDFFIGAGCAPPICNSLNNLFNGLIDEVSIYDRAATAAEINSIYQAGVAGKCKVPTVLVDIKPRSFPNSINLGSNGNLPVAILSDPVFDARTIDPLSINLAGATVALKGKGTPMASFEDVNEDGLIDLVVHVSVDALQLTEGDTAAFLEARTFGGAAVAGSDAVRVVP